PVPRYAAARFRQRLLRVLWRLHATPTAPRREPGPALLLSPDAKTIHRGSRVSRPPGSHHEEDQQAVRAPPAAGIPQIEVVSFFPARPVKQVVSHGAIQDVVARRPPSTGGRIQSASRHPLNPIPGMR